MNLAKYRKALVAIVGFLTVLASVLADGVIIPQEYESVFVAAGTALSVYLLPNIPLKD